MIDITFDTIVHNDAICHLSFDKDCSLHMCMIRIQEFYESDDPDIRNKKVSIEDIIDSYINKYKKFDYFDRWAAFNIPGNILLRFQKLYKKEIRPKEKIIFDAVDELCPDWQDNCKNFYLICTFKNQHEKSDVNHEVAHALYYINKEYKKEADELINKCTCQKSIFNKLKKWGYAEKVFADELQAYLGTSSDNYLKEYFKLRNPDKTSRPFKQLFNKYRKDLCQ